MTQDEAALLLIVAAWSDKVAGMVDGLALGVENKAVAVALAKLEASICHPDIQEAMRVARECGAPVPTFRRERLQ